MTRGRAERRHWGGGKPPKGGGTKAQKFNLKHHPSGSPEGGRFAPKDGGGQTVAEILGPEATAKLQSLIDDPNSTAEEILAVMKPLDDVSANAVPTIAHDKIPTQEFWEGRTYNVAGKNAGIGAAVDALDQKALSYAGPNGPLQNREALILIGPPAAGKSTSAERLAQEGFSIVDSDDAKKVIPEFSRGVGAPIVHEESGLMSQFVLDRQVERGDNIIIPKVGAKPESIMTHIRDLQKENYNVALVLVDVNRHEAARRMAKRALRTNRAISSTYFSSIGDGPQRTYEHIKAAMPGIGHARIDGNGPMRSEKYVEAKNVRGANPGQSLF